MPKGEGEPANHAKNTKEGGISFPGGLAITSPFFG
jgi:hypothetical protein